MNLVINNVFSNHIMPKNLLNLYYDLILNVDIVNSYYKFLFLYFIHCLILFYQCSYNLNLNLVDQICFIIIEKTIRHLYKMRSTNAKHKNSL